MPKGPEYGHKQAVPNKVPRQNHPPDFAPLPGRPPGREGIFLKKI
jgi:hypothetical protein